MIAKLMAIVEAIKLIGVAFKSFNSYIIQPFIAWNKKRKDKKIDKHYEDKINRRNSLTQEIEAERTKNPSNESDERLRELTRKLQNLGGEFDKND